MDKRPNNLPGELVTCERCGQKPDSVAFDMADCCLDDCPFTARQDHGGSSRKEIAAAAHFAWARPMKEPRRVGVSVAVMLLLIAHASFSVLAVGFLSR